MRSKVTNGYDSRRDGSPFMNLLQCAPLCDSQGTVRYFIGAQIDVSGLAMEGAQMDSLCALLDRQRNRETGADVEDAEIKEDVCPDEFRELSELFSPRELNVVHNVGGNLFKPIPAVIDRNWTGHSRTWSTADTVEMEAIRERDIKIALFRHSLTGVYENVCLSSLISSQVLLSSQAALVLIILVPPCSALSVPSDLVYLSSSTDPWYSPIFLLDTYWWQPVDTGRITGCIYGRT